MPKKNNVEERARFVVDYINESTSTTAAVKELSAKLFLSERTIYNDLEKGNPKEE